MRYDLWLSRGRWMRQCAAVATALLPGLMQAWPDLARQTAIDLAMYRSITLN